MDPGLLTADDPLLPHVKKRAAKGDLECLSWVLGSARRWAVGEFARRLDYEDHEWRSDPEQIQQRVAACRRKQAAVLIEAGGRERVYVGMCSREMSEMFVRMQIAPGNYVSGVYDIRDIFELPPVWTVNPWPHELDRADTGKPDVGAIGPFDVMPPPQPVPVSSRRRACKACWGKTTREKLVCAKCLGTGVVEPPRPTVGTLGFKDDGTNVVWTGTQWRTIVSQEQPDSGYLTYICDDGARLTVNQGGDDA